MLKIENLTIATENREILKNISLTMAQDEIVAIVGQSGSGKTTLLKSILALPLNNLQQKSGTIQFDTHTFQLTNKRQKMSFVGVDVSWITQSAKLSFNEKRTIKAHYNDLYQTYKQYTTNLRTLEECFKLVDLSYNHDMIHKYPFEFSGGQMQRVGVALSLVAKPKLLLADEPTSALDALNKKELVKLLKKLHETENMGILIVTHDMSVAKDISDRLVIMKDGEIVEQGLTSDVLHCPKEAYTKALLEAIPTLRKNE